MCTVFRANSVSRGRLFLQRLAVTVAGECYFGGRETLFGEIVLLGGRTSLLELENEPTAPAERFFIG